MTDLWIVAARRTPQGRFLGSLARRSATDLAVAAGETVLDGLDRQLVDQVILGNVIAAGQGMNIARQVGVRLELPIETPAFTVNMMCASGAQAVALAAQAIRAGEASVVLCGGTESMSNAPYLLERARRGYKLGDGTLIDSLMRDGLIDSFHHEHMAETAERLAQQYTVSREAQDCYAAQSQQRYQQAQAIGQFREELVPVDDLTEDEHPRPDTTAQQLASLSPAFRTDGTITAGNAAGINDGAAMLVLCSAEAGERHGWTPLARLTTTASVGCDPKVMGLGPVHATRRLCERGGHDMQDFDVIELNEAFAAQTLACLKAMGLEETAQHVNPHGGAIALGHPVGASGARLIAHLAHQVAAGAIERGLATLCVGGGMGIAASVETVNRA